MTIVGSRTNEAGSLASKVGLLTICDAPSTGPCSVSFDPQIGWRELMAVLAVGSHCRVDHPAFGSVAGSVLPSAGTADAFTSPPPRIGVIKRMPSIAVGLGKVPGGRGIGSECVLSRRRRTDVFGVDAHRAIAPKVIELEAFRHWPDDLLINPDVGHRQTAPTAQRTESPIASVAACRRPHPALRFGVNLVMPDEALHRRQTMRRASCEQWIARRLPSSVMLHAPRLGVKPLIWASVDRAGFIHGEILVRSVRPGCGSGASSRGGDSRRLF
jgi:hypothetical protein